MSSIIGHVSVEVNNINSRKTTRLELPFFDNTDEISRWISVTCPYFADTSEDPEKKLRLNIGKLFTHDEKNFCPILIDDRSHVSSVVFVPDEEGDNDDLISPNKPKTGKIELPFSQFYAGDFGVSFASPSSSSSLLPKSCSILFLHSVLRLSKSAAEDNKAGPSVFLSNDLEDSLSQPQKDFILKLASVDSAKIDFISDNLHVLVDLFLPIIDASSTTEETQSESVRKSNIEIVFEKSQNEDGQEKHSCSQSHLFPPFISLDDMSEFYDNHDLLDRLLFSYSLVLTTFGWKIHNLQDGTVDRNGKTWKDVYSKYQNNNDNSRDAAALLVVKVMTRVLRSLIEFRLKKIAKKFVQFIWEELCSGRLQFLRQVWEFVWVPMVLVQGYYRLENENVDQEKDSEEISADSCCRWHFDEAQRESWLKKLKEIERGSSDDE